jgi:small-conductance mechanosensitive channel
MDAPLLPDFIERILEICERNNLDTAIPQQVIKAQEIKDFEDMTKTSVHLSKTLKGHIVLSMN